MAERKLTKSELRMKKNNPKRFAELQKIRAKRSRGFLTSKTIRDAGQGKGKAAITAMEKRANQAGKKAERQALQKGASPSKAKQAGKKAARAIVSGSGIKTAINLGMVAANVLPVGKAIRGVKAIRSVIKGGPKPKPKPKIEKKTEPKIEKKNKSKLGPSSYTPPQGKALTVIPKKTKVPKLNPNQKSAIKATAVVPAVLGANALLKNKPDAGKKKPDAGKKKPDAGKKKPTSRKITPLDLSYRDDEGSPIGTEDRKRTIESKPDTRKSLFEAMFSGGEAKNQIVKNPFTGNDMTLEYDYPDDPDDMKKGGSIKKNMKKKKTKIKKRASLRGQGKALRGF